MRSSEHQSRGSGSLLIAFAMNRLLSTYGMALGIALGVGHQTSEMSPAASPIRSLLPQHRTPPCSATLDGTKYPGILPAYLRWRAVFDDVRSKADEHLTINRDSVGVRPFEVIQRRVAGYHAQASKILSAPVETRIAEAQVADAVLDARDDLMRDLSQEVFATLGNEATRAGEKRVSLPAPGRPLISRAETNCQVTVRAKEYPHLIPENMYWRFYFLERAGAASRFRIAPNEYSPLHVSTVQKTLQIPAEDIVRVINIASNVIAEIDRLPKTAANDLVAYEIADTGRVQLLKTLQKSSWLAVKEDAQRSRGGMTMVFPPSR